MSLVVSQLYEFGKFRLDTQERVLWCEGKLVPLTPKLLETLIVLVERHGHIVDKQKLLERVWPDTFVEEANVARHVSLLRKTLGEWTDTAELIETLPRRGYRFIAPVHSIARTNSDLPAPLTPTQFAPLSDTLKTVPAITGEEELIVATHTITRITAEEETDELSLPLPATPRALALPPAPTGWQRNRRRLAVGGMAFIAGLAGLFFFFTRNNAALNEKDTLLLADFVNRTGDPVFDGTLRQGLAVQLDQSPFLTFLSDQRVRETLKLMTRSPEEPITPEIGREICVRQGLKALIRGEIAPLGKHYVLTLEAIAGQTGDTLARAQSEAESKEQVLHALSLAASELRGKLGESLSSLQKFAALLETTTSSLPALQNLSLGVKLNAQGKTPEALSFVQRAVELDPNFANGWITLAVYQANNQRNQEAAESAARAYALRDRVTELERFRIEVWYHQYKTRDLEKAVEVLEVFRRTYPRYGVAHNTLSRISLLLGQFEQAKAASREALNINPVSIIYQVNLAETLLATGELAESKAILDKLRETGQLTTRGRFFAHALALVENDEAAQQRELAALKGQPDEYQTWGWLAGRAARRGQAQQVQAWVRKTTDLAASPQFRGTAAGAMTVAAIDLALLCAHSTSHPTCDVRELTRQALAFERSPFRISQSLVALALNGWLAEAQALATELQQQAPQDTRLNMLWLPLMHALQALQNQQPAQAIEHLRVAERYEGAAYFLPQYVRGLAWLQRKNGFAAAAEFEKIRMHPYFEPSSPLLALAHLGLARAAALQGDAPKSRQMYQEFFQLWKEADANLPALRAAKEEFAKLN